MSRFLGKVAIVTGSSNGIGREAARQFSQECALVTITGRDAETLEESLQLCLDANGGDVSKILLIRGDITEEETRKQLIDETVAKFGKIDILVNNAGGATNLFVPDLSADVTNFDATMDLNCKTVIRMCQLAYPYLQQTKGEIINISSIAGLNFAVPFFPFYGASKAAQDQITRSLAAEYIQKGVRVNSINPGVISTNIIQKHGAMTDEQVKKIELAIASESRRIPIGRPGTPAEVANVILFLADRSQSEFIVGHMLRVDGGSSIHNPFLAEGYMQFAE